LERLTGGPLAQARMIGLTVDFDFTVDAGKLQTVLTQAAGEIEDGPVPEEHRVMLDRVMFGGWRQPFGAAQAPFDFQDVALSSPMSPQIKSAMRELRDGNNFSITPVPSLDYGIEETGKNVIIGVVDFGCDFAHPSFCSEDRKQSRILKLWDQNDDPEFPLGPTIVTPKPPSVAIGREPCAFGFGRVFEKSDIDRVLEEWQANHANEADWPYQALGYDPHHHNYVPKKQANERVVAHGTCVLDVAASRDREWKIDGARADNPLVKGVAPQSDIVFVQVRTREQRDGRRVLDPNDVVDGVAYIFHVAAARGQPCVVNLSLNTMSGPHDGDGHFERRLSNLLRSNGAGKEARGRAVVVAAGNLPDNNEAYRTWQHLADRVGPGQPFQFLWKFTDDKDVTRNSLEIWYEANDAWLQVSLNHPNAGHIATVSPGYAAELFCNGTLVGSIIGSRVRPAIQDSADLKRTADLKLPASDTVPGRHVIYLSLDPHATATGSWKISLTMVDAANQPIGAAQDPIAFNVWLERDDNGQTGIARREGTSSFIDPPDRNVSIGTLSCGTDPIVVAAYDASTSVVDMWNYSASGPTALEGKKPDISAPGASVWLIVSKQETMRMRQWGTSIAAPFVTGTIACMFEAAPAAELETIRAALRDSARGGSPGGPQSGWSPQLGWGRLNPKEAVHRVRATSSTPSGGRTEDHVARRLP
jgi:subtilisin family serine protease